MIKITIGGSTKKKSVSGTVRTTNRAIRLGGMFGKKQKGSHTTADNVEIKDDNVEIKDDNPVEAPPEMVQQPVAEIRMCPGCASEVDAGSKYCTMCGTMME